MTELTLETDILKTWVGKTRSSQDLLDLASCLKMSATVERESVLQMGDNLPPLWHWLYFHDAVATTQLSHDGHAKLGDFLPPVALGRRMWAGGRLRFVLPLVIGVAYTCRSVIRSVVRKSGASGELCFVTVEHTYLQGEHVHLVEEHDIVYLDGLSSSAGGTPVQNDRKAKVEVLPAAVRASARLCQHGEPGYLIVTPSVTALFRYSALTFNSHRIHYDRDYCRDVEGYAGLVFHGPLTATLMAGFAEMEQGASLTSFNFRALKPILDTDVFQIVCSGSEDKMDVHAVKADGQLAMQATACFN